MARKRLKIGRKYWHMTVVENLPITKGRSMVRCVCDCGNTWVGFPSRLVHGKAKSCGCIAKTRHGMSKTALYSVWQSMKDRCFNKKNKCYRHYGGRGITVCNEWLISDNFLNWALISGYQKGLELDRINNNCSYSPDNCRWATRAENVLNKRTNHFIIINGAKKTISEWAKIAGISPSTFKYRMEHGFMGNDLLQPPIFDFKKNKEQIDGLF